MVKSLVYLCKCNNYRHVNKLLSKPVNINQTDYMGRSGLIHSCKNNNYYLSKLLISNKININIVDYSYNTAFIYACIKGGLNIVKLLIKNHANINHVNNVGNSGFLYSCMHGNINIVKFLCKFVDINQKDYRGYTGMHIAYLYGNNSVVEYLISIGADLNIQCDVGNTILHSVCEDNNNLDILELLIINGININIKNINNVSGFLFAWLNNNHEALKLLVCVGYDYINNDKLLEIKSLTDFINSKEYILMNNRLNKRHNNSSDIFSLIVLISDDYFKISEL